MRRGRCDGGDPSGGDLGGTDDALGDPTDDDNPGGDDGGDCASLVAVDDTALHCTVPARALGAVSEPVDVEGSPRPS